VLVLSSAGLAAVALNGNVDQIMAHSWEGLEKYGRVHAATFGKESLYILMSSGKIMNCPSSLSGESTLCSSMDLPYLPAFENGEAPAAVIFESSAGLRAAVASSDGIAIMELVQDRETWAASWQIATTVLVPSTASDQKVPLIVSISSSSSDLLALTSVGATFRWPFNEAGLISDVGVSYEMPSVSFAETASTTTWMGGCTLPGQKVIRLANTWQGSERGGGYRADIFL